MTPDHSAINMYRKDSFRLCYNLREGLSKKALECFEPTEFQFQATDFTTVQSLYKEKLTLLADTN